MKKVGFFSGSFNPIHNGHIAIAEYMLGAGGLDEVWFSVTPQNPIKRECDLLDDGKRQEMVKLAIVGNKRFRLCDVEQHLPRPSYTITALQRLEREYPDTEFHLLIGSDNWAIFPRWKESEKIIADYQIDIYPRPVYPVDAAALPPSVRLTDAPMTDISSTVIRAHIAAGKPAEQWISPTVHRYIMEHDLYKNG